MDTTSYLPEDTNKLDVAFMQKAIKEALIAYEQEEVPIGCIIVQGNQIIARGHNQVEKLQDCTAHAEIIAITAGCNHIGSKYLTNATMYVTMEPCLMCAGAIYWSRISRLVIGCMDEKKGFRNTIQETHPYFYQKIAITYPILEGECSSIVKNFFKQKRQKV